MSGPSIFHVGYDSALIEIREAVLHRAGYRVHSVKGNDEAMRVASQLDADLVIIGNGGTFDERAEIVNWLAQNLPNLPILVMRVSKTESYPGSTVEFIGDTPNEWLQTIEKTVASHAKATGA